MQAGPRAPGSTQPPVKIYNAVYSAVQVTIHSIHYDPGLVTRSRLVPGLRVHDSRHRRHAQAKRLVRQRDADPQGRWGRQGATHEDTGERNFAWETRNCAGGVW